MNAVRKIGELLPGATAPDVFRIDYRKLRELGFRGLIFDIDNTLVPHNADSTPEVDALLRQLKELGFKVVLVSDNNRERVLRFLKNIDAPYICEAGKPDPACFEQACRMMGLEKKEAVVIGDQLFMDIRGANRCGIPSIHVAFIRRPGEKWHGWRRYLEYALLFLNRFRKKPLPKISLSSAPCFTSAATDPLVKEKACHSSSDS